MAKLAIIIAFFGQKLEDPFRDCSGFALRFGILKTLGRTPNEMGHKRLGKALIKGFNLS